MRFMYGIIACGVIVVVTDLCFVYWAMNNGPELEDSYLTEER